MTTALSTDSSPLYPGYYEDLDTGAWCTLPWPGDPSLPYGHPSRLAELPASLGPQIILWGEENLIHPLTGDPWRYTPGQKRFLHMWYAVDDVGYFKYRSGCFRGAKGVGKDYIAAAMCVSEFCGPVHLVDWEGDTPVGAPHRMSLVQIGANSLLQTNDVLRVANQMIPDRLANRLKIDKGQTRTLMPTGSRIERLTASEKSAEGDPATFICLNETHHFTQASGGERLAAVARRNVGKSPAWVQGRLVEFTNAHQMGMDSVAEKTFEAWQAQVMGKTRQRDILYNSVEAPPGLDLSNPDDVLAGLEAAYMDAPWADFNRLMGEIHDIRTTVADTIRFYFNGLAAEEDAWVEPAAFDECARPDIKVEAGEKIALFLDCSKNEDATALVGCRLSDGHVMALGCWQRPHGKKQEEWLVPREEVDAQVRAIFDTYKVVWFGIDPSPVRDDETGHLYWMPLIETWHQDFHRKLPVWASPGRGGHSVLFDMRLSTPGARERMRMFTEQAMQTVEEIEKDHALTHDGNPLLRQHVFNARRRPNQWGVGLGKLNRDSAKKVDYAVTMVGARLGRRLALRSGKVTPMRQKGGAVRSLF